MTARRRALQAAIERRFNSVYSSKFITPRESLLLRLTLDAVLAEVLAILKAQGDAQE